MIPSPHLVITPGDEGGVVLNKKTGDYFRLNLLGLTVITMINEGQDEGAIVRRLQSQYPESAARIPTDVAKLVGDMVDAKLVSKK